MAYIMVVTPAGAMQLSNRVCSRSHLLRAPSDLSTMERGWRGLEGVDLEDAELHFVNLSGQLWTRWSGTRATSAELVVGF